MEVQLHVYIRRYRENFTTDLGQIVIKSSNRFNWRVFEFFEYHRHIVWKKKFRKAWSWLNTYEKEKKKITDFNTFKERHQLW